MTRDPHKILGLKPGASHEEIRSAYLRMVKKYHPDAGGDAWVFSEIQSAYEALTRQKAPAGAADSKRAKPTAKAKSSGDTHAAPDRAQSDTTQSGSASQASHGTQADAKFSHATGQENPQPAPGAAASEFSFATKESGSRRRRRRTSDWATMVSVALGGLMALSLGWYLLQTRPDLVAFFRGETKSSADASGNSANQAAEDSAETDSATKSEKSPAMRNAPSKEPGRNTPTQPPSQGSVPKPNLRDRPNRAPESANGQSKASGVESPDSDRSVTTDGPPPADSNSSPTPASVDSGGQTPPNLPDGGDSVGNNDRAAKPAPDLDPADSVQLTGIESLDADIIEFDRRLAAAQREPTELKRQTKLDDAIAWMEKNCKRARARIKFQVVDIRRGDGEGYVVKLGPPDPGNYPRLMSYPKIAEMNLDENDALRVGEQYRLEVTGYTGFQWGSLDPSKAIVFYASECPLAPIQPGAAFGPNFGAFPTDYVYRSKDSLYPAYWILLDEAELRIVKAKD